jgi:FkbM family methyltransferase
MAVNVPTLRFLASRALWATRLSSLFTMQTACGYKLRFYPTAVSATMWCNPQFYAKDEQLLGEQLGTGDTFVDVGANIGTLTLAASRLVGPSGRVFAIEAHPRTVRYLRGNVRLNSASNVTVLHAAVGDHVGTVKFSNRRSDDQNSIASSGIEVPLATLDSMIIGLLPPASRIRLLKIDVEGFELFALRGADRVLERTDAVYFESWENHFQRFGYSTKDLLTLLRAHGFDCGVDDDHRSDNCENLLASRKSA